MDYRIYRFSGKEWGIAALEYAVLDGLVSYLFYRSLVAFLLLLPGMYFFYKIIREEKQKKRGYRLNEQFLTGMQAVSNALSAGYSIENAFGEALTELEKVYGKDEMIVREFQRIVTQLSLNLPLEGLIQDLAARSGQEDILNFAQVFGAARRSGGDLIAIIRNTVSVIQQKSETRQEIQVSIAAKKMEQNVMSLVPLLILLYVDVASPEFIEVLYGNPAGVAVMSVCLLVYVLAWSMGRRIVNIEV